MALKFLLKSLDGLSETDKAHYIKVGDNFQVDIEGAVDIAKVAEFRDTNVTLRRQLEEYGGVDPKKVKELQQLEQQVAEKKLLDAGKIDEIVSSRIEQMKSEHTKQIGDRDATIADLTKTLEKSLLDGKIREVAADYGVAPSAVEDVIARARGIYKIENGAPIPYREGKVVYGKNGVDPMPLSEWIPTLKTTAAHLFGETTGQNTHQQNRQQQTQQKADLTPVQKIAAGFNQKK